MDPFEDDAEQIIRPPATRREAREVALKALYALELSGNSLNAVLQDLLPLQENESEITRFARRIIKKTFECREDLDRHIRARSDNWEFDRIAIIDKLILRIAICEFLFFFDIPPKVSIDEAIELAKTYSTAKSKSFVNGILDAVLADLKSKGQIVKTGRGLRNGKPKHC